VAASEAWEEARRINRLDPFFMAGPEFEAFVEGQVEDFQALSREIGLIR
jgi:tripartite-type tricarboxylate transporter receptor subunit TctC